MKKITAEWVRKAEADYALAKGDDMMCLEESSVLKLSFRHTFNEIMEVNKYAPEVRFKAKLVHSFAVISMLVGSITLLLNRDDSKWIPLVGSAGFWILVGLMVTRIAGFGAWIRSKRPLLSIEFSKATVSVMIDNETIDLVWENCGYFYETPKLIVLRVPGDAIAIPKRACGSNDILLLLRLLKQKLPTRPPSWRWYWS